MAFYEMEMVNKKDISFKFLVLGHIQLFWGLVLMYINLLMDAKP